MPKVISVDPKGTLFGIVKEGDNIIAFNDNPFKDILDYIYADSDMSCRLSIIDNDGYQKIITAQKDAQEDTLGLEFDSSVALSPRRCENNCIFCFVNQLPAGLRESLYIKDDDFRLSFLYGNYISCTNLTNEDIKRIIKYQLSPLYISVHSTNEDIRKTMLGRSTVNNQVEIIKKLIEAGIDIHAQIVLVPTINDYEKLQDTLTDLYQLEVRSVAVVPVGITKYRQNLYNIEPISQQLAIDTINIIEAFYQKCNFFCYASDELYQIAKRPVRDYNYYGSFSQIENGVGLIARFLYELEEACKEIPKRINKKIGIITGLAGEETMMKAKAMLEESTKKLEINVYAIENNFFGNTVTVTGLITATDIITYFEDRQIKDDFLIIPEVMLKDNKDIFLDDITLDCLKDELNKKVLISSVDGERFLETIINGE